MYVAIAVAVSLLTADRVLKHLSRTGKLRYEGAAAPPDPFGKPRLFMNLGQQHPRLVRWMPWAVWLLAAVCLLPQLSKRAFAAQLGISLVLSGGVSNQYDRLRRAASPTICNSPPPRQKRALVWNLADFMLLGGAALTALGLLRELVRK